MFCYVFTVMNFGANSGNRMAGCDNKLEENDINFISEKVSKFKESVAGK